MIYPLEARALADCFFENRGGDATSIGSPLEVEWRENHLTDCLDSVDLERGVLTQLRAGSLLRAVEEDFCSVCGVKADLCSDHDTHDWESETFYSLCEDELLSTWVDWLRDSETFSTLSDPERISEQHWRIDAVFQHSSITFQVFLESSKMREHSFSPDQLEFGFGFLPFSEIPSEEYVFPWYAPLERSESSDQTRFETEIEQLVTEYEDAITARIVSMDAVEGFQREVRSGLENTLSNLGFDTSTEISRCDGYRNYSIEPIGDDFVAIDDIDGVETHLLFCRCDKGRGSIHFHTFQNGQITSPEEIDRVESIIEKISGKIDRYRGIRSKQQVISKTAQIAAVLATLVPILYVANIFADFSSTIASIIPKSVQNTDLPAILAGINIVLVVILVVLIFYPQYQLYTFSWVVDVNSS